MCPVTTSIFCCVFCAYSVHSLVHLLWLLCMRCLYPLKENLHEGNSLPKTCSGQWVDKRMKDFALKCHVDLKSDLWNEIFFSMHPVTEVTLVDRSLHWSVCLLFCVHSMQVSSVSTSLHGSICLILLRADMKQLSSMGTSLHCQISVSYRPVVHWLPVSRWTSCWPLSRRSWRPQEYHLREMRRWEDWAQLCISSNVITGNSSFKHLFAQHNQNLSSATQFKACDWP